MKHKIPACAALLLLAGPAAPALAGSVYVPLATDQTVQDVRFRTQVWATNTDVSLRQFTAFFIPADTDGTDRPENWGTSTVVSAGATMLLGTIANSGETGMLEISGAPHIVVSARLVPTQGGVTGLGASIPVIGSANQFAADATAHLQGWVRSGDVVSDFGVVNLGRASASCSIDVFRSDGSQIQSTAIINMPPLSHRQFDDALGLLGEPAITAVRSETTCDQPFYVYVRTYDRTSGELHFSLPSLKLADSTLAPPGTDPPEPVPEPVSCQNGALCYSYLAEPYIPRRSAQNHKIFIAVPPGSYRSVRLQLDVVHGGWRNPSSGLHNILWLARDSNFDLIGYVNLLGPNKNKLHFRHGMGLSAGDKPKIVKNLVTTPGETYHFDYLWDAGADRIELVVTHDGEEVGRIVTEPNARRLSIGNGNRIEVAFSFEAGLNPNEPPTYGWEYKNLKLEFVPE